MIRIRTLTVGLLTVLAAPVAAATQAPVAAPASPAPAAPAVAAPANVATILAPTSPNILRAGSEIPLITREELTTKKKQVRVGQRVQLEVASNVLVNGVVVVPGGTPAVGEVTEVRNKGMWGKSGYIAVRVVSMRLGDRQIRLSGTFDDKGVTGTGGVVAAVAFVPIAGFFTTGTSAAIPSGSGAKGFLEEDISFAPSPVVQTAGASAAAPAN